MQIKNMLIDDYTNIYSVDIFDQLFTDMYKCIIVITGDIFYIVNHSTFDEDLQQIRININRLNFLIRRILILQAKQQNLGQVGVLEDVFLTEFTVFKQFFNYTSNEPAEVQQFTDNLLKYCIMDEKYVLTTVTIDINTISETPDVCCSLKYIFQLLLNLEMYLSKIIPKIKSFDINGGCKINTQFNIKPPVLSSSSSSTSSSTKSSSTKSSSSSTSSTKSSSTSTSSSSSTSKKIKNKKSHKKVNGVTMIDNFILFVKEIFNNFSSVIDENFTYSTIIIISCYVKIIREILRK